MTDNHFVIKCRNAEERDKISDLLQRNRRLEEKVHKAILGGPLNLTDSDIIVDALYANLSAMHVVVRLLQDRAG